MASLVNPPSFQGKFELRDFTLKAASLPNNLARVVVPPWSDHKDSFTPEHPEPKFELKLASTASSPCHIRGSHDTDDGSDLGHAKDMGPFGQSFCRPSFPFQCSPPRSQRWMRSGQNPNSRYAGKS
ncbi:uncharacterized protein CIMG_05543 [Coccidioides immitis RS]|uniref:Uncharacterized protein n=1 Tax=Coccidioides immitis (strain RS) TaxID=246410 RepID=J3KFT7_COCIM|nr:uncharacterized protein CIMG_05543 [Coccidioides immitis RS]EAS34519.3 hypothetical protein CIMG_05543 [Coccidioides immitis RS]